MHIQLSEKQIEMIAQRTAKIILRKMKEDEEPSKEMVTVHEAACMLGVSDKHMRRIKEKYPHIKNGSNNQGRLLFFKDALFKEYAK